MPTAVISPTGPLARVSSCLTSSITATPIAPPMTVATGEPRCITSGRISPAAAANTTPAAKCWMALTMLGPGRVFTATVAPMMAAAAGMSVYIQAAVIMAASFPRWCRVFRQSRYVARLFLNRVYNKEVSLSGRGTQTGTRPVGEPAPRSAHARGRKIGQSESVAYGAVTDYGCETEAPAEDAQ